MTVYITNALRETFELVGVDTDRFIEFFEEFKNGDPHESLIFGWDNTYETPRVNGLTHTLRHVHMMPQADERKKAHWIDLYRQRKHKTSDRALVYVTNRQGDHLLIEMLEEPEAHTICKMLTPPHKLIMKKYATIASDFLISGKISY